MAKITVRLEDGNVVEIMGDPSVSVKNGGALLGKGGQGAVYKVKNLNTGKICALKRYLMPMSAAFIKNLRKNIAKGAPNDSFLWPLGLTEPMGRNKDIHGYVMDLYDSKKYSTFVKIIKGQAKFPSKEMQIAALLELVEAFEQLHAKGYSYQDLNDGGILFDCANGKVLICDNDNVAEFGDNLGIKGKFKWMAPEVAIEMFRPDKHSDRFSLAVLMFYMLTHAHPFDGKKRLSGQLTATLQKEVYGTQPVFIFHPTDKSNRPDPQIDANAIKAWPMLPDFIQNLFIKTFTAGMPYIGEKREVLNAERQERTTEREWREALIRWLDTMASCPACGKSVCPTVQNNKIMPMVCPHCGKKIQVKRPVLIVKKRDKVMRAILLEEGKQISKSSVTREKSNETAFQVIRSKKNANMYGILNKLPYQIKCAQANSKDVLVDVNCVAPALNGVRMEFDYDFIGEIYYDI